MAIRGTIEDIPITDILQLLHHGFRSGRLEIVEPDGRKNEIFMLEGRIIFAETEREVPRIGELLVEEKYLDIKTKEKYLRDFFEEEERGERFGNYLMKMGVIDQNNLESIIRKKLEGLVHRIISLNKGSFTFEATDMMPEEEVLISLDVNQILVSSMEREDEWVQIRQAIPDFNVRFIFSTNAFVRLAESGTKISWMEWHILNLLDGTRTISDVANRLRQDDMLNLCKTLKEYHDKGIIYRIDEREDVVPLKERYFGEKREKPQRERVASGFVKRLLNRIRGL